MPKLTEGPDVGQEIEKPKMNKVDPMVTGTISPASAARQPEATPVAAGVVRVEIVSLNVPFSHVFAAVLSVMLSLLMIGAVLGAIVGAFWYMLAQSGI